MKNKYIKINKEDNVAVALEDISCGTVLEIDSIEIELKSNIQRGHKFAINKVAKGSNVIKYGYPIGYALFDVLPGEHVHTHNIKTLLKGTKVYTYTPDFEFSKKV